LLFTILEISKCEFLKRVNEMTIEMNMKKGNVNDKMKLINEIKMRNAAANANGMKSLLVLGTFQF